MPLYGGYGYFPDLNQFINEAWGWPVDSVGPWVFAATNVVVGPNPPYSVNDFLAMYPKFGGAPVTVNNAVITTGSPVVQGSSQGIIAGAYIASAVPDPDPLTGIWGTTPGLFGQGAAVKTVDGQMQFTVNQNAIEDGTSLAVYTQPFVPMHVLNMYVYLASVSLQSMRWCEAWYIAMSLFIAHYCTLYLRSDGDVYSTPGQAATAGLARGIAVSKSVGGASISYQPVMGGLEDWGSWNETAYGSQLATMARSYGAGPMLAF